MQVSADLENDYLYRPRYEELSAFVRVFRDPNDSSASLVMPTKQGWTQLAYKDVPNIISKGSQVGDEILTKTRSFDTKQEFLTFIKHGINPCDGSRLNVSQGLILNKSMRVNFNQLGSIANHIPVLFARVPTKCNSYTIITAYEGIYNFRTRLFHGQIELQDYREIWKE